VQEVPGSNPGSPTNPFNQMRENATAPARPAVDEFVDGWSGPSVSKGSKPDISLCFV
jgi:hypothetical protein